MEQTWDFIWSRFFDRRTCMFYNYSVGNAPDGIAQFLPEPLLIQHLVPNPAGYGSGMEDCMLNAGIMMDTVIARYEATGDAAMGELAADIYKGMELDATVSCKKGFLPRGVSPEDCKSHYIDTSRDQYTNWFFGAFRLYYSALSSETQKESIRRCLTAMAEKFEREVIPENNWSFLREDGKAGFVGKMWECAHAGEPLRLPMLYLLTWKTTDNPHWKEQYLQYRDSALAKTSEYVPLTQYSYLDFQVQYSLRLVYELDEDPSVKATCLSIMQKIAQACEKQAVAVTNTLLTPEGKEWLQVQYVPWDKAKAFYSGFWGGFAYFCPDSSNGMYNYSYYPLRAVGEYAAVAAMCPGWKTKPETLDCLLKVAAFLDYDKHCTNAPIALLAGYWLTMAGQKADADN